MTKGEGPNIVDHGEWKGRKEQDDCFVWLLGGRAESMQQRRRSDNGRSFGNARSGLENDEGIDGVGSIHDVVSSGCSNRVSR